jgi:SAM-dependent methyltransferase
MPGPKPRRGARRSAGLPAADRAMWTRLYAQLPARSIPWMNRGPFAPLVRAVEDGWLSPPGSILDVGCGMGTNSLWLATKGFQVTGIDVAPGAIAAGESAREPGSSNPDFLVDDVLASGLPRAGFGAAIDVGCFQTVPPSTRAKFSVNLARLLTPGATFVLFWVAREETGSWGPPHRMSVGEVTESFEPLFRIEQIVYRPRTKPLTPKVRRSSRPLSTLAGYSARLVRRSEPQPASR